MLSPADGALVERDRAIPGLALVLDADALLATLRRALPGIDLRAARVTYLRYKPGMSCLATCELQLGDEQVDAYLHAYGPAAGDKLTSASQKSSTTGPLGPGQLVFPEHALVVAACQNDEQIPGLKYLVRAEKRLKLLRSVLPGRHDLHGTRLERLSYKPKRRYVGAVLTPQGPALVVRAYAASAPVPVPAQRRLYAQGSILAVAPCVALEPRRRIQIFEWLPGTVLRDMAGRSSVREAGFRRVGQALAELHDLTDPASLGPMPGVAQLASAAQAISTICPMLAARSADLAQRLAQGLESLSPAVLRPLHGDFHPAQALIHGERVGVLDFDRAGIGDPAYDLGAFIAHLERDYLTGRIDRAALEHLSAAFIAGYAAMGGGPSPASVRLHTAAALLRVAPEQFRYRDPDWAATMTALLERAAQLAAPVKVRATGPAPPGKPTQVDDPYGVDRDPAMPFLKHALDPETASRELSHALAKFSGGALVQIRAIRVIRHKPARRCLVEYDLDLIRSGRIVEALTLVGKVRARGSDTKMFACLQALWRNGFDDQTEDGVSIPEPVALVPALHLWLQRKVPGAVATSLLAGQDGVELARRITDAIHKLHRVGVQAPRTHTMADELGILRPRLAEVARVYPTLEPRLSGLMDACERVAADMGEARWANVHRDFYPDQVLVDGSRLYLVDLDLYAQGDPAIDVGNFIAHLIEQGLRLHGDAGALSGQIAAMLERFASVSGDLARVHVYVALTLARHVSISTQIPERRWTTLALLELAERHVQTLRPGGGPIASSNGTA